MHFHLQFVPIGHPKALEFITKGQMADKGAIKLVASSLMRNNLAYWANPAVCYDTDCPMFSYREIEDLLDF